MVASAAAALRLAAEGVVVVERFGTDAVLATCRLGSSTHMRTGAACAECQHDACADSQLSLLTGTPLLTAAAAAALETDTHPALAPCASGSGDE